MHIKTLAAFFILSLSPSLSFAGKAILDTGENGSSQIQLEYYGANLVRLNMLQQDGAYMILRDGKAYSIFGQGQDVMVIDMASMGTMSSLVGNMSNGQNMLGEDDIAELVSFEDTGRKETVAGASGDVYEITFVDGNGNKSSETLVLSNDPRAREMTSAFMSVSKSMMEALQQQQPKGFEQLQQAINNKGLLRFGSDFRVAYFESGEPSASRFDLPAEPQSFNLGSMVESAQQSITEAEPEAGSERRVGILSNILGNQAERQQNRIEDKSEEVGQEIDSSVDSAVDKAVDRVFKSIFDR